MANAKHSDRFVADLFRSLLNDDLLNEAAINRKANKIRDFFPRTARGHGSTGASCNAPNCVVNGGRNDHVQETFSAAKTFVLSSFGSSTEE